MTFQSSYAKLLADPTFGQISKRKEHARQMYIEGMKRAKQFADGWYDQNYTSIEISKDIEKAIAEESK